METITVEQASLNIWNDKTGKRHIFPGDKCLLYEDENGNTYRIVSDDDKQVK